ncbi:ethanolamine utilization protein EutN [bacterium CPR1]|jgi:ethanolamine utilization protein EutN|nr:ethanolamine utilization protein EutN [bacterium CPR1]
MMLGRVVGTVVCTQKDERLEGVTLQLVLPLSLQDLKPDGKPVVAVDTVGAGEGEVVLVVAGSSARQTDQTQNTPTDAVIMAIVDSLDLEGKRIYSKKD